MGGAGRSSSAERVQRLRRRVDPVRVVDQVQVVKTAVAGGLAWWIATDVGQLEQAFLAPWDTGFRDRWCALGRDVAEHAQAQDVEALEAMLGDLEQLARDFSEASLSPVEWRQYGALVMNLRNVHDALTRSARAAREATPDRRRSQRFALPLEERLRAQRDGRTATAHRRVPTDGPGTTAR